MKHREAKAIVAECLMKLPKSDRRRLMFHAEMKTRIATKSITKELFDNVGRACIYVLAGTRKIPYNPTASSFDRWDKRRQFLKSMNPKFEVAISSLTENSVRLIMSKLK